MPDNAVVRSAWPARSIVPDTFAKSIPRQSRSAVSAPPREMVRQANGVPTGQLNASADGIVTAVNSFGSPETSSPYRFVQAQLAGSSSAPAPVQVAVATTSASDTLRHMCATEQEAFVSVPAVKSPPPELATNAPVARSMKPTFPSAARFAGM